MKLLSVVSEIEFRTPRVFIISTKKNRTLIFMVFMIYADKILMNPNDHKNLRSKKIEIQNNLFQ